VSDRELIENMPVEVVQSLIRLFDLFDIRRLGYVSSLEVAAALRGSDFHNTKVSKGNDSISTMVASGESEKLAQFFEGRRRDVMLSDSITSHGSMMEKEEDGENEEEGRATSRSSAIAGRGVAGGAGDGCIDDDESLEDIALGEESSPTVMGGNKRVKIRIPKPVDRQVTQIEFILAFRNAI
jgi:hypothetical protein